MKRWRRYIGQHWRSVSGLGFGFLLLLGLLLYKLGTLVPLSLQERQQQAFAGSWHHLLYNPLNAPLTILQWAGLTMFPHRPAFITRLPSTIFGVLSAWAMLYILRRWYGVRTAVFGSLLFLTSSWFLHVSRYASMEVIYLWAVPTLLALHLFWERAANRVSTHYLVVAGLAVLLYVPGMLWLIVVTFLLQSRHYLYAWRRLTRNWQRGLLVLVFLLLLLPLGFACFKDPHLTLSWLGLPPHFSHPNTLPHRLVHSISFFIWRGPLAPTHWLDRLPILNIFNLIMLLLGLYFYGRHLSVPRSRLLLTLFIVSAIFYAIGGPVGFSLMVALVLLVVAGGLGYLLHEWLLVFPRNPLARSVGYILISLAVALSCVYEIRAYFIAWPHNSATIAAFHKH